MSGRIIVTVTNIKDNNSLVTIIEGKIADIIRGLPNYSSLGFTVQNDVSYLLFTNFATSFLSDLIFILKITKFKIFGKISPISMFFFLPPQFVINYYSSYHVLLAFKISFEHMELDHFITNSLLMITHCLGSLAIQLYSSIIISHLIYSLLFYRKSFHESSTISLFNK